MPRQEPAPFNNPFRDKAVQRRLGQLVVSRPARPTTPVKSPPVIREIDDDALWALATRGGVPLQGTQAVAWEARAGFSDVGPVQDPDANALAALTAFARGEGVFELWDQDEFVQGVPDAQSSALLERLRRGELSVQAWVDRHRAPLALGAVAGALVAWAVRRR